MSTWSKGFLGAFLLAGLTAALPLMTSAQITPQPQSPMAQARKQVNEARTALTLAKTALDRARAKVEAGFGKENPAYATAQKAYATAQSDLKKITAAALATLRSKPDYLDAVKAKLAAKDKQAALQADSKSSEEDLQAAFNAVLADAKIVSDMENAVTQDDPKIVDAKQRLADAKQTMDDFKSKIDGACAADPDYQQAYQTETTAEQTLAQAQASLQQQAAATAAQAAQEARSRAQQPSGGTPGQPARRGY